MNYCKEKKKATNSHLRNMVKNYRTIIDQVDQESFSHKLNNYIGENLFYKEDIQRLEEGDFNIDLDRLIYLTLYMQIHDAFISSLNIENALFLKRAYELSLSEAEVASKTPKGKV